MGESDSSWGRLAEYDSEMAAQWDSYDMLPERGVNEAFDAFLERKRLSVGALVRMGARLSDTTVLAFEYHGAIKYRDMVTDRRWTYPGSELKHMKLVRHRGTTEPTTAIVAEGETDGATLSDNYPDADIFVLPAGANGGLEELAPQLAGYELVLMAQDFGTAGDKSAKVLSQLVPAKTARWLPPIDPDDNAGWNDSTVFPPLPVPDSIEIPLSDRLLVSARDLLELDAPEQASWFEQALLPIGGSLIIHGWAKSYKTFIGLDMLAAIAQREPWSNFEPTEEPVRVAIMQYEVPWPYFQQRVRYLRDHAAQPDLFLDNFLVWTPMARPRLKAGDRKSEDGVLRELLAAGVQVFYLDPIRRATGAVNLNDEKDVRPLLEFFERVQNNGITVVTVHHDNKAAARSGGGSEMGMTGSGAFAGDFDSIVSVAVPQGETTDSKTRDLHFLLRNAPSPPPRSFEMTESGLIVYHNSPLLPITDAIPGSDEPAI